MDNTSIDRAKIDYPFRSYVLPINDDWENRYKALLEWADECGDHVFWSQSCGTIEPIEWLIWSFKDWWRKEKFDLRAARVMYVRTADDADRIQMGIRDVDAVAKRMRKKANMTW